MEKKIKLTFLSLFIALTHLAISQSNTDIELHNRYWNYRENFRKYFTVINEYPGGGLPFSDLKVNHSPYFNVVDAQGNNTSGDVSLTGQINVGGDVTAFMAEYMGILASEYWLLHNGGKMSSQEEDAVLNELYFVLYAMERLDKYAKKYYGGLDPDTDADGFFVREDAPLGIYEKLVINNYPEVKWMSGIANQGRPINTSLSNTSEKKFISNAVDENGNPVYVKIRDKYSDNIGRFRSVETHGWSGLNEMSQDQLIGVLFGFKCIMKFVEPFAKADPDGANTALPEKNIHEWVKYLTDKMMLHLTKTTYDVPMFSQEEINQKKENLCDQMMEKPWRNDITGDRSKTEGSCKDFSAGSTCSYKPCDKGIEGWEDLLEQQPNNYKIAAHANYVLTNPHNGGKEVTRGPFAYIFGYPLEKIGEEITGNDYPEVKVKLSAGVSSLRYTLGFILTNTISLSTIGKPFLPESAGWWQDIYNYLPKNSIIRNQLKEATGASMHISAVVGVITNKSYYCKYI